MIREIRIRNFQSHKDTVLKFKRGVNVITGTSDSGKTALLRALKWLVWNRPLGDSFRSHWGGDTSVAVKLSNGTIVERFKGKSGDYYKVKKPGEESLVFKAFGTEPPEEVQEALNVDNLNVQNQMDSSFLISNNPGEVSRHFNEVANISQIDDSLKLVERWVRGLRAEVTAEENDIERHEKDLESYAYLDKAEQEVEVLESLQENLNRKRGQFKRLGALIERVETVEDLIQEIKPKADAEEMYNQLVKIQQDIVKTSDSITNLSTLILNMENLEDLIGTAKHLVEDEAIVNNLLKLYNKKERAANRRTEITNLISNIETVEQAYSKAVIQLEELEERWHEEMPATCPLCGSKTST